jgi:hypothetical protein
MLIDDKHDNDSIKAFSSEHRTSMREEPDDQNFRQHPYRFVSYPLFVLLVVFLGLFLTSYTPLEPAMIRVV